MIFNMVGGGAGGAGGGATLVVSSPVNVSVTVSKDDKSYTKNSGSLGSTTFKGLATGTWTVTISGNGQTATRTIEITADYAITIAFFSATINITYPANSTCVVTNSGGQTVASDTNTASSTKTWTATVNATGTYIVTATATDGSGKSKSQSVEITSEGQSVSVTLNYETYIYKSGVGPEHSWYLGMASESSGSKVTYESDHIYLYNVSNSLYPNINFFDDTAVNLTDIDTLYFDFDKTSPDVIACVNIKKVSYNVTTFAASITAKGIKTALDVSGLSGNYYIGVRTQGTSAKIYNIYY